MLAAMVLGADAVQVGSRFVASPEASSHELLKICSRCQRRRHPIDFEGTCTCALAQNKFFRDVQEAYAKGASKEELKKLLGRARAKKGCSKAIWKKVNWK